MLESFHFEIEKISFFYFFLRDRYTVRATFIAFLECYCNQYFFFFDNAKRLNCL